MRSTFLFLSLVSVLFFACGKTSNSKKIVRNSSTKDIKILIFDKPYSGKERESYTIEANHEAIIVNLTSRSGPMYASLENCVLSKYDSVSIIVPGDNSVRVVKDLTRSDSWMFSKNSNIKGIDVGCRATITNADIVSK
ncbi:hypothetical protein [Niabella aurantiaca]|uniref:hypothetical protein n=1 Tax=Niabella aurantiaca TaxID=379900 RepID=UPI000368AA13|nr:hypothetical protein [Niabella aurantiaca]